MRKNSDSREKIDGAFRMALVMLFSIVFTNIAIAAPPSPHGINGYIFSNDGVTQMPLGTRYSINDSNSTSTVFYKQSLTSFPAPGYSGYYTESIQGTDGDNVTIYGWNDTSYGVTNILMSSAMSGINVTINLTRDPEPTVNITSPPDNTLRNDSAYFAVTSNITLYGNNANNCFAQISYQNTSVLSSYNNQPMSISLGSLQRGYSNIITWNISGIGIGNSNATVNFTCDGMFGTKFEILNYSDTLQNITIKDTTPPNITLLLPQNNTKTMNSSILFFYNVSDLNSVSNCSLYINSAFKQMNTSVLKYTTLFFNDTINEGVNTWFVTCNDSSGNMGFSKNYTIIKDTAPRTASADLQAYIQGWTARISGYNWTNSSIVTIVLARSDSSIKEWNVTAAANGIINTTYWINYSDPTGIYNITAYEYNYNFYFAAANFTVTNRILELITDNLSYPQNTNVTILGFNFTMNGTISIRIFENGRNASNYTRNVTANASGDFFHLWNASNLCPGVYGVTAASLNYTNYSLTAYFNITDAGLSSCVSWGNTAPNVTSVLVDDFISSPSDEINLLAAQGTGIYCNFTVTDLEGYNDIVSANATFYYYLNKSSDADDNNTHYSNSSCLETGNNGVDTKYFTCGFSIQYYANNGTWQCNATAYDTQNAKGFNNDSVKILELYAINVTPLIDFGSVPTGNISADVPSLVTNLGNTRIDVNISAYGVTPNDGIAMNCTNANISLADERYSISSGQAFASMTGVTSVPVTISAFNLLKQVNQTLSYANLYWKVRPTPPSLGDCQGVVVVTGVAG